MTKVIGLVCEGPRDCELISSIIDNLFPDVTIDYRYLQPDQSLISRNYNGWKGVLRWCYKDYKSACESKDYLTQGLDLFVIQSDGDVSRDFNNKQSHCSCIECECEERKEIIKNDMAHAEDCMIGADDCPLRFPCTEHHEKEPDLYIAHLNNLIETYLGDKHLIPTVITVPCDSTDTWVVAAVDELDKEYELIEDTWDNIIARGKYYHGIRIPGKRKTKNAYKEFIKLVIENWHLVTSRCEQAYLFQKEISEALLITEDGSQTTD